MTLNIPHDIHNNHFDKNQRMQLISLEDVISKNLAL